MVKDNNSDDNMQLSQRWVQTSCSDKTARYLLKKWTSSTSKHCIIKSGFFIYIFISQIETAQFFISLITKTTRIRFETSNWLKLNYKYILDWWDNLINLTNKRFCLILCYGNLNTLVLAKQADRQALNKLSRWRKSIVNYSRFKWAELVT